MSRYSLCWFFSLVCTCVLFMSTCFVSLNFACFLRSLTVHFIEFKFNLIKGCVYQLFLSQRPLPNLPSIPSVLLNVLYYMRPLIWKIKVFRKSPTHFKSSELHWNSGQRELRIIVGKQFSFSVNISRSTSVCSMTFVNKSALLVFHNLALRMKIVFKENLIL